MPSTPSSTRIAQGCDRCSASLNRTRSTVDPQQIGCICVLLPGSRILASRSSGRSRPRRSCRSAREFARLLDIKVEESFPLADYPRIKCNIARRTDERIYNLPFDQQYDSTVVEPAAVSATSRRHSRLRNLASGGLGDGAPLSPVDSAPSLVPEGRTYANYGVVLTRSAQGNWMRAAVVVLSTASKNSMHSSRKVTRGMRSASSQKRTEHNSCRRGRRDRRVHRRARALLARHLGPLTGDWRASCSLRRHLT